MASVYQKRGTWYASVIDATGRRRNLSTKARTKTEARRLADEIERKAERQRLGIEAPDSATSDLTLAALCDWWTATYLRNSPSRVTTERTLRKHLSGNAIAALPVHVVTAQAIEAFLQ